MDRWYYEGDKPDAKLVLEPIGNAQTEDFAKKLFVTFSSLQQREGGPNAINTYDLTFTYGTGFNITTGVGRDLMKLLLRPPKEIPVDERDALECLFSYLRKAGVYFALSGDALSTRVAHVEKRGNDFIGWVIDDVNGTLKCPAVPGESHNNSIALDAIRYRPQILDAFAIAGAATTLPGQEKPAAEIRRALVDVQWQIFLTKQRPIFKHYTVVKTQALFNYLVHMNHFMSARTQDGMLTWAIARRLIVGTATYTEDGKEITATKPIAFRSKGVGDTEVVVADQPAPRKSNVSTRQSKKGSSKAAATQQSPGPVRKLTTVTILPSVDIDIQIGQLVFNYARQPAGGDNSSWKTWGQLWGQFKDDLKSEKITQVPVFPLQLMAEKVAEVKKSLTPPGAAVSPQDDANLNKRAEAQVKAEYEVVDILQQISADLVIGETLKTGQYVGLRKVDKQEVSAIEASKQLGDVNFVVSTSTLGAKP